MLLTMDYLKLMYWTATADNVHTLLIVSTLVPLALACVFAGLWGNCYVADRQHVKRFKKATVKWLLISILPLMGVLATPDEDDMLMILAGTTVGQALDSTNQIEIPDDMAAFLRDTINKELEFAEKETRRILNMSTIDDSLRLHTREELYEIIHVYYRHYTGK